jgi:hypothetical protein
MSYSLELFFDPAVQRTRLLSYFAARKHHAVADARASYENPDTGVYFSVMLRCVRNVVFRKSVAAVELRLIITAPAFSVSKRKGKYPNWWQHFNRRGLRTLRSAAWQRDLIRARDF